MACLKLDFASITSFKFFFIRPKLKYASAKSLFNEIACMHFFSASFNLPKFKRVFPKLLKDSAKSTFNFIDST